MTSPRLSREFPASRDGNLRIARFGLPLGAPAGAVAAIRPAAGIKAKSVLFDVPECVAVPACALVFM